MPVGDPPRKTGVFISEIACSPAFSGISMKRSRFTDRQIITILITRGSQNIRY